MSDVLISLIQYLDLRTALNCMSLNKAVYALVEKYYHWTNQNLRFLNIQEMFKAFLQFKFVKSRLQFNHCDGYYYIYMKNWFKKYGKIWTCYDLYAFRAELPTFREIANILSETCTVSAIDNVLNSRNRIMGFYGSMFVDNGYLILDKNLTKHKDFDRILQRIFKQRSDYDLGTNEIFIPISEHRLVRFDLGISSDPRKLIWDNNLERTYHNLNQVVKATKVKMDILVQILVYIIRNLFK